MIYPKKVVYLAGTISGLDHDEARWGWRKTFDSHLLYAGHDHILCASPMRGKDMLVDAGKLEHHVPLPEHAMTSAKGITTRDFNDVKTCDLMVACYLEGNGRPSLGTAAEYGYAYALQKPIITVGMPNDVNVQHLMLQHMTGYHVETVEEAAFIAGHLLTPRL